jgi:hypothetical protein
VKGRFILESVISTHEIIHDVASRGDKRLIMKVDYEKHMIGLIGISLRKCC